MNIYGLGQQRKTLALTALAIAAVVWVSRTITEGHARNEATTMVSEISRMEMRTVCVGRFLIDVPADADVSFRSAFLAGWDISSDLEETDAAFEGRLQKIESDLRLAKNERGEVSLESVRAINSAGVTGKIFVYDRHWGYTIENGQRVHSTHVAVDASVRIRGISFDFAETIGEESDVDELAKIISQLEPQAPNQQPQDSGFCFDGGFLKDPLTASQNERVSVFIGLKGHPDVAIAVNTMAGLDPDPGLLQRDDENSVKNSNPFNFKTIRKGKRSIGEIPGEEVLELVSEPNGTKSQLFMWESRSQKDSVYRPELSLELATGRGQPGRPVNSSLSDARALALWDRISASLRLRPTTPKQTSVEKPALPLGSLSLASKNCPQTGWWQCTDGSAVTNVVGGSRRHFIEGQMFPQVVLSTPGTLWQNIRGEQRTFTSSTPSSWRLIDRRKAPRTQSSPLLAEALPQGDIPTLDNVSVFGSVVEAGAEVPSGSACPASGWWECVDAKALDGTRWFARGHKVPPATVSVSLSLAEKIRGAAQVARVNTNWRLVRAAQAPSPSSPSKASAPADATKDPQPDADGLAPNKSEDA